MRLIETNAARRRRPLGIAASIILHTGVIALAVVGTTRAATHDEVEENVDLVYVKPPTETAPRSGGSPTSGASATAAPPTVSAAPTFDAADIPPVDVGSIVASTTVDPTARMRDTFTNGLGAGDGRGNGVGSPTDVLDANAVERAVIAMPGAAPRYPETLRSSGISGRVLARFVVDTLGRVEMGDVAITAATHPLFADAVRRALPAMRFRPAEAHGRRVRQLVEMPFEFVVR